MAGVYFHIPFCRSRCVYCDFFSSTSLREKGACIDAICKELQDRKDYLQGQEIRTIYFGGGTPSLLPAKDFDRIFQTFDRCFGSQCSSSREVTLEANPDDITPDYLHSIRHLPFNRISLGVQSFNNRELLFLNRRHDALSAINAVKRLQDAGYPNLSIDLIYGLPEQTRSIWEENLKQALALDVPHISAYHLTYEEGTPLFSRLERGLVKQVDEESSLRFFEILIDTLTENGFEHYEISNFAKPGYRSRHNSSYWNGTHYLGIGASAHSYNGSGRRWNKTQSGFDEEILDGRTAYNDFIITRLRTSEGIEVSELSRLFGEARQAYCLRQAEKHILNQGLKQSGNRLHLTRKGLFVSDGIMSDLLLA
ncbi:MAG: radical SAM family heme chaperone HemW [Candidatus Symbiothrix sp.]|jgi:oxygen-independent coproporphyrinogen-3 oxidase|nr:radical SAM family heme chaperone HemW [Candidatus Symbiothrix sp.]